MAADGRMRRRSRRIREGSARAVKPRGGIRSLLKSSCGTGKPGDRGIRAHAAASGTSGHVVKPSALKSDVKPTSVESSEEAWIYVRGCRIERPGLRFNSQGEVYVPDSEDEDEVLEVSVKELTGGVDLALRWPRMGLPAPLQSETAASDVDDCKSETLSSRSARSPGIPTSTSFLSWTLMIY